MGNRSKIKYKQKRLLGAFHTVKSAAEVNMGSAAKTKDQPLVLRFRH